MNTFCSRHSAYRDSISVGNAFFASSFGAPSLVRKPPATSWHRNFFLCSTLASHSWPSVYTLFFLLTTSNPSSGSHSLPISTLIRLGKPGSEMLFCRRWSLTQQVKLTAVMFGLPFTTAFVLHYNGLPRTVPHYIRRYLVSCSDLVHCQGMFRHCYRKSFLHRLTVCSPFPVTAATVWAASLFVKSCTLTWTLSHPMKGHSPSLQYVV